MSDDGDEAIEQAIASLKQRINAIPKNFRGNRKKKKSIDENGIPVGIGVNSNFLENAKVYNYSVDVIVDSDNPDAGSAIYNPNTNTWTFHLHEGYTLDGQPNKTELARFIVTNQHKVSLYHVVPLSINPTEVRTCKYFTAPNEALLDSPVIPSKSHKYDKGFKYASCSNPNLPSEYEGMCQAVQNQAACRYCELETWEDLVVYQDDSDIERHWKLQSIRKGFGYVGYRVIALEQNIDGHAIICETNNVEHGDGALMMALEELHVVSTGMYPAAKEVPIINDQIKPASYFEYAFNE